MISSKVNNFNLSHEFPLINKGASRYPIYFNNISERDRIITLSWLTELCNAWNCDNEIFHLARVIFDLSIQKLIVNRKNYQLVAIVALHLACIHIYDECDVFPISEFIYMTNDAYEMTEFKKMEQEILSMLHYNFNIVTLPHVHLVISFYLSQIFQVSFIIIYHFLLKIPFEITYVI